MGLHLDCRDNKFISAVSMSVMLEVLQYLCRVRQADLRWIVSRLLVHSSDISVSSEQVECWLGSHPWSLVAFLFPLSASQLSLFLNNGRLLDHGIIYCSANQMHRKVSFGHFPNISKLFYTTRLVMCFS